MPNRRNTLQRFQSNAGRLWHCHEELFSPDSKHVSRRVRSVDEKYVRLALFDRWVVSWNLLDCWQSLPSDRPSFNELFDEINTIIERNYSEASLSKENTYHSLHDNWREEIQTMFEDLKNMEQVRMIVRR